MGAQAILAQAVLGQDCCSNCDEDTLGVSETSTDEVRSMAERSGVDQGVDQGNAQEEADLEKCLAEIAAFHQEWFCGTSAIQPFWFAARYPRQRKFFKKLCARYS